MAAAVLLAEEAVAAARDAAVGAVKCEETPVALLVVVFVAGFVEGRTGRVVGFAVELAAGAAVVAAEPSSGAVESIVVSSLVGGVVSAVL